MKSNKPQRAQGALLAIFAGAQECVAGMRPLFAGAIISFVVAAGTANGQSNGSWQNRAPLPTARQELATAAFNGKIYVMGGYDIHLDSTAIVEVYDPGTDTWSTIHPLPSATNHNAAAVAGGKLYSINGALVHYYDPASDSWIQVAHTLSGHYGTPAVGIIDEKIYIAGGVPGGTALEVYDPATDVWTTLAPMHVPRNHCAGGVINGKFYVAGGRGSPDAETAFEAYDPSTNTWETPPGLPTGHSGCAAAVVNNELFVLGGELPGYVVGEVEAYNPVTNTWRTLPPMDIPRHGIWASVIGNSIYVPGGSDESGFGGARNVNSVLTLGPTRGFDNISTRAVVQTDDNVLIGGFVVSGGSSKRVLVRAPGPTVPVPAALMDTRLELYDAGGHLLVANDNWMDAPNKQEIIDTGLAPGDAREAAILTQIPAGGATAIVRGANSATGVALVEIYDVDSASAAKLANISTRGIVQTGNNLMIGGFILSGSGNVRVLLRARGPSLPLTGTLADPRLELRDANGTLRAANDNWRSDQQTEIAATGLAPANDAESAIIETLSAGGYTALVRGVNENSGIGIVEAFALP
jgi:N-acetylneuraminic acid mutarotase